MGLVFGLFGLVEMNFAVLASEERQEVEKINKKGG